jgi:hypothetical protein
MSETEQPGPDPPATERGGTTEIDDQPMGVQPDADEEDAPLPGLPEKEPPASE